MSKTSKRLKHVFRKIGLTRPDSSLCAQKGINKVFGIGLNKTGTSSLARAMGDLGFDVAPQRPAELLLKQWTRREFAELAEFCNIYEFFQDAPFSFPYTYIVLDQMFPGSKFILTIRDNPEQWINSLFNYHVKLFGNHFDPFDWDEVDKIDYVYQGWLSQCYEYLFGFDKGSEVYDRKALHDYYVRHNGEVCNYFRFRDNLLVVNVAEEDAYRKICQFLGCTYLETMEFPRLNITREIKSREEKINKKT